MNSTMTYEMLYNNMVKKFTVEKDNTDAQDIDSQDEKYICPHCKNIILIPKK